MIFRICYIATKGGFTSELFKFIGTITAIYLPMHYSILIADYVRKQLPIEGKFPQGYIDLMVFVFLSTAGYLFFVFLRKAFNNLVKIEAVSSLNKWGGLILGGLRSVLLVSLISFALVIPGTSYLKNSVKHSYLGIRVYFYAPDTYSWIFTNVFLKFMPSEKEGGIVLNVKKELI
jgi:uncharacterized membrane protein required for colicin V production